MKFWPYLKQNIEICTVLCKNFKNNSLIKIIKKIMLYLKQFLFVQKYFKVKKL